MEGTKKRIPKKKAEKTLRKWPFNRILFFGSRKRGNKNKIKKFIRHEIDL